MMERVVEANPALAEAYEAGVDVQLGTYVWGAFVNGPTVRELPGPLLGLADDRRSWLVGYDRLVVAAGARDVALGFPGWERAGAMGANGACVPSHPLSCASPPSAWSSSASGSLGLGTAALALQQRRRDRRRVEVGRHGPRRSRTGAPPSPLAACRSTRPTRFARRAARSARSNRWWSSRWTASSSRWRAASARSACDTICLALGLAPNVELLSPRRRAPRLRLFPRRLGAPDSTS